MLLESSTALLRSSSGAQSCLHEGWGNMTGLLAVLLPAKFTGSVSSLLQGQSVAQLGDVAVPALSQGRHRKSFQAQPHLRPPWPCSGSSHMVMSCFLRALSVPLAAAEEGELYAWGAFPGELLCGASS